MSRVTKATLGSLANAAGLDMPTPQGRFRRVVRLAIPTGGSAQGAAVDGTPVLDVTFLDRELDATAPGAPEAATLAAGGGGLVLSLPVAREIARIRLAAPQSGDHVAAFRVDGSAVSEAPVVAAPHGAAGAALGVTDRSLILRRRNAGDHALGPATIAAVVLRYPPVNPRLLIAVVTDTGGEQALPPVIGAGGQPVFPASMSRGGVLAGVLERPLRRLAEAGPLPDPFELDLILEADQPCAARIDALDLGLTLERRGFAGDPGKRVLRFRGGRRETQTLELALPPDAARLEGTLGFSVAGAAPTAKAAAPPGPAPVAGADGVALAQGSVVAGRIDLPRAEVVVGAEIVLAATEPLTTLVARLHADRDGRPDAILAESGEMVPGGPRPVPIPLGFPATAIPAGPVWLALSARRGAAVAMLGSSSAIVVKGDGTSFAPIGAATGSGLAAVLRFAASAAASETGLVLRLGGQTLAPAGGTVDLAPALSAQPAPRSPALVLSVSADVPAVVTLDPPVLRYTLQQ